MAEATDDLSAPLGQRPPPRRRLPVVPLLTGAFGVGLAVFLGFALFGDGRGGGEPAAVAEIGDPAPPAAFAAPPAPPAVTAAPDAGEAAGQRTVTIIDGSSGTRKSVTIPAAEPAPDSESPEADPPQPGAAVPGPADIDPRLQESSRHGLLPVAAAGLAPVRAYAAPAPAAAASGGPMVAVVLSGLGISAAQTAEALRRLPPAVTLGFPPYGAQVRDLTARARAAGHEILLQVPMEPLDYPDNDPGPQTLLTSLAPAGNLDRLHWHMSRFAGYVGLMPFMGARLVADDGAMQALLAEAARRGLGYFDDGRIARSVAPQLAANDAMPFARADLVLDAAATPGDIDAALLRLEQQARERGIAIGTAAVTPVMVARIAAWAQALAGRGVALVPLTTAMLKSKSS